MDDRRHESRRNLNLQVEYPGRQGYPIDSTESVSSDGLFIRSAQHHRVGEELRLAIGLPGFPDTLQVSGVVTRIREATATTPRGVALRIAEDEYDKRLTEIMTPAGSRDFNLVNGPYAVLASLPRIRLAATPTPLHHARRLSKALGGPDIWLKRDDLTGFALGGTEVRKMEFIIADALQEGADTLVIASEDANASKVRVMSAAAARLGMSSAVLLPAGAGTSPTISPYCTLLGTEQLRVNDDAASPEENLEICLAELRSRGKKPYGIGEQQSWLGACGYMLASIELLAQLRRQHASPQILVCPVGGGETMSGLVLAQRWLDCDHDVLGVSVRQTEQWCCERVATIAFETFGHLHIADTIPVDDIWVRADHVTADPTSSTPRVLDAIEMVARLEGIFLDPRDSGIAMASLIDQVKRGELSKGQSIVFLVAG